MSFQSTTRIEILKVLNGKNELTIMEFCDELPHKTPASVKSSVWLMHKNGLVHVARYEKTFGYRSGRYKPVYSSGPGKDAKEPKADKKARYARHREKNRVKIRIKDRARRGTKVNVWLQGLL